MNPTMVIAIFGAGLAIGALVTYLVCSRVLEARVAEASASLTAEIKVANSRAQELTTRVGLADQALREKEQEIRRMEAQVSGLRAETATFEARLEELNRVHDRMKDTFAGLSAEALKSTTDSFFQIAKREFDGVRTNALRDLGDKERAIGAMLDPIRNGLLKYDARVEQLSKERDQAFGMLTNQLQSVERASVQLSQETQNLSRALRSPGVRGRWGEMQLKRVLEIAGMLEHCDFDLQATMKSESGTQRPDAVIRLPGGRSVAVDSKVPLSAYLEAIETQDDDKRKQKLKEHANQLRSHSENLGKKAYWESLSSPEFVVLFLPSEVFFSAAVEQDPSLIEDSFSRNRVIVATPTTLIALLQGVAYGWRQENLAQSAAEIADLGRELYERLSKLDDHIGNLGDHLEKAMKFYNNAVGALESRVLVSARRFKDLGIGSGLAEIPVLEPIEMPVRGLRSPELTDGVVEQ